MLKDMQEEEEEEEQLALLKWKMKNENEKQKHDKKIMDAKEEEEEILTRSVPLSTFVAFDLRAASSASRSFRVLNNLSVHYSIAH